MMLPKICTTCLCVLFNFNTSRGGFATSYSKTDIECVLSDRREENYIWIVKTLRYQLGNIFNAIIKYLRKFLSKDCLKIFQILRYWICKYHFRHQVIISFVVLYFIMHEVNVANKRRNSIFIMLLNNYQKQKNIYLVKSRNNKEYIY